MHPKYTDGMANSVDPDLVIYLYCILSATGLIAVWFGCALFAETYMYELCTVASHYYSLSNAVVMKEGVTTCIA